MSVSLHRYWRVLVTATQQASWVMVANVQFRDAVGGNDLTGCGAAIQSSGSCAPIYTYNGSWEVLLGTGAWFGYDFGIPVSIAEVVMQAGNYNTEAPKTFKIQYGDDDGLGGINWSDQASFVNQASWGAAEVRAFATGLDTWSYGPTGAKRYWQVQVTENVGLQNYLSFKEIEMMATLGGSDITSGKTAQVDSGTNASYLIDDNDSTSWISGTGGRIHTVGVDFASAVEVAQVALKVNDPASNGTPRDFRIRCSSDGSSWWTVATYRNQSAWTAGERRTFVTNATAPSAAASRPIIMCVT